MDYLDGEGEGRRVLLVELLHSHLEQRLRAGETPRVFDLVKQFPQLWEQPDDLASLIKTEISCLRERGDQPSLQQYQAELGAILGKRLPELFALETRATRQAKIGSVIAGRYKLLAELGEGGMGSVYAAEQLQPVRRMVAVKLIKPGMDSSGVLARFEAERQALALMDHPNIAKMLDGGITEDGQPFFVMEQVKGLSITKFCDQEKLSLDDRLELFTAVCQGVQHAHQKGIIHRDLKPSNILVTLIDGKATPKVIDFGVAKALHQKLTERTMYTEAGRQVGTIEYMSPEQADLNNLDVDTRSDVYALGVILYEMLTGQVPFSSNELRHAAYDEMLRIIREKEPTRPSMKLSSSVDLDRLAHLRQMNSKQLSAEIQGELDWIVMKCLEKERVRRYDSALGIATDISRYRNGQVVSAHPPSRIYRMKKFIKRHRIMVGATSIMAFALAVAVAGLASGLIEAKRQQALAWKESREKEEALKNVAEQRRVALINETRALESERVAKTLLEKVQKLLEKVQKEQAASESILRFLQDKLFAMSDPKKQSELLMGQGISVNKAAGRMTIKELLDLTAQELAEDKIDDRFPGQKATQIELVHSMGEAYYHMGEFERAIPFLQRLATFKNSDPEGVRLSVVLTHFLLADALFALNRRAEAIQTIKEAQETFTKKLGNHAYETIALAEKLAATYQAAGEDQKAVEAFLLTDDLMIKAYGKLSLQRLLMRAEYTVVLTRMHKGDEAARILDGLYEIACNSDGIDLYESQSLLQAVAHGYSNMKNWDMAILALKKVLRVRESADPFSAETKSTLIVLGHYYSAIGKHEAAIRCANTAHGRWACRHGMANLETLRIGYEAAVAYQKHGEIQKALGMMVEICFYELRVCNPDHPDIRRALDFIASCATQTQKSWGLIVLHKCHCLRCCCPLLVMDPLVYGVQNMACSMDCIMHSIRQYQMVASHLK